MLTKITKLDEKKWKLNANEYSIDDLSNEICQKLINKLEKAMIPDQKKKIEELEVAMQNSHNKLYGMQAMLAEVKTRFHETAPVVELYNTKYPDTITPIKVPGTIATHLIRSGFWSLYPEKISNFVYKEEKIVELV